MAPDPKPSFAGLADEARLASAFERLRPRLLAMVRRRVGSKLAARLDPESVVQDAFLRALSRWRTAPEPANLEAWIYRQVLDGFIEATRAALGPTRDAAREVPWPEESTAQFARKLFAPNDRAGATISEDERRVVVQAALQGLDPIDREILALRYFDGLGFDQIAAILGLEKSNTANTRALRALRRLRKLIPPSHRPPGESSS